MEITIQELNTMKVLKAGAEYLEACGVPDSRTEADILLAYIRNTSRDKLYLDRDTEIRIEERDRFTELLLRRGAREPFAYLLKTREFMGLEFYVDRNVLIPRPETELLVEKTMEAGKRVFGGQPVRILDLCTGSGAVAVSLAHLWPASKISAGDISQAALTIAERNAQDHNVNINFQQGDLFQPFEGRQFDMIVSNPPYVSTEEYVQCSPEVRNEPKLALVGGDDGLEFYRRIANEAGKYLNSKGMILLEIGYSQGREVCRLLDAEGFHTVVFQDYAGLDRVVQAEKR